MASIIFYILFGYFNDTSNLAFMMSFEEESVLPVFNQVEKSTGILIAKQPLSYIYKHYYTDYVETIVSNGVDVKIINTYNNQFDPEQIVLKKQKDFFTKEDLKEVFKSFDSFTLIKVNMKHYVRVLLNAKLLENPYFKSFEIMYYEPSLKFKYIKYETKTGVKVSIYPSLQQRIVVNSDIFNK